MKSESCKLKDTLLDSAVTGAAHMLALLKSHFLKMNSVIHKGFNCPTDAACEELVQKVLWVAKSFIDGLNFFVSSSDDVPPVKGV